MTYQVLLSNGSTEIIPVLWDEDYPQDYVWQLIEEVLYQFNDTQTSILEIKPSH